MQHATLVENVRHRERRDSQTVGDIPDRAIERSLELGTCSEEKFASAIFRARLPSGGGGKG